MKTIYRKSLILTLAMTLVVCVSCEETFLETAPTTDISDSDIYSSTETVNGVLLGVYNKWRTFEPVNGRMDQSGLHSYNLAHEVMTTDVIITKSWYSAESALTTNTASSNRVKYAWRIFYNSINNLNNVLANIDEVPGEQADKDRIKAEALGMRGFCYFNLVRTYMHTYAIASSTPSIPIYLTPTTAETKGNPKSTVSEVYQQIVSDLTAAANGLSSDRDIKGYMNKDVANGLLARVYMTMENYSLAATHAAQARASYPLMSGTEWKNGFNDDSNVEWIWSQHNNATENPDWGSAIALMGYGSSASGEGGWRMVTELVDSYSATDVRGEVPVFDAGTAFYATTKFVDGASRYSAHYPLMRASEMALIEAEAAARSNNDSGAQDLLFEVQTRADASAVKSTNTGQALLDEIFLEKRKEFWGEGVVYWDMMRNQMPIVRPPSHNVTQNIPANSWQMIFQIPESELLINENISLSEQNPLSGTF